MIQSIMEMFIAHDHHSPQEGASAEPRTAVLTCIMHDLTMEDDGQNKVKRLNKNCPNVPQIMESHSSYHLITFRVLI